MIRLQKVFRSVFAAAAALVVITALFGARQISAETKPGLENVLDSIVLVVAEVPGTARTAGVLGQRRVGSGVVIDSDGLVLTIGFLILESSRVILTRPDGSGVPAKIVAYDGESGFGLVRALQPLKLPPMRLGSSAALKPEDPVLILPAGGRIAASPAMVVSRRTFPGYWEYLLEDAIFTVPMNPRHPGSALVGADGRLLGIGYLAVGDARGKGVPSAGNMFVPIDKLKPILASLIAKGRREEPPKPWLGVFTSEIQGRVHVTRVAEGGPAQKAGVRAGAIILKVDDKEVTDMTDFLRRVRTKGSAGITIKLTVLDGTSIRDITITSADRTKWLRLNPSN